jgi:hypothetical protein
MRQIGEVPRLRFGHGLQQEQIARSYSIAQAAVHRYLERATAAGLSWPLAEDCDDRQLNELLFPARPANEPAIARGLKFIVKPLAAASPFHVSIDSQIGTVVGSIVK